MQYTDTTQWVRPEEEQLGINTKISALFTLVAVSVMLFIGIRHFNDLDEAGQLWGQYALYIHVPFGVFGYVMIQIASGDRLIPRNYRPIDLRTMAFTGIVLVISILSQVIAQTTFSITNTEKALYVIFSAVTEEVFFRGFMCYAMIRVVCNRMRHSFTIILAKTVIVSLSGLLFAVLHTHYYGTAMLWGTLIGGILYGTAFVFFLKYDLTAMIFGHFILNLIVTGYWLVNL